jgi:2-pyrone-4,6-dicarboxylate lactonase
MKTLKLRIYFYWTRLDSRFRGNDGFGVFMNHDLSTPILTYNPNPSRPALKLPANACDSHVHIFGPGHQFPYAADRKFTPVDAGKDTLFALHKLLGISRCVIVQSIVHGFDNSAVEVAIQHGEGRYLGVALVPTSILDTELQRLSRAGFKGVRFHFMNHLAVTNNVDEVVAFTHRLKAVGMHLQVHFESSMIHRIAAPRSQSAVPVVIDHMGRVDATKGADHADFAALLKLLKNPLFHVKVSGIDRIDATPSHAPEYSAGVALAKWLVSAYPDQCIWGTDFPHPNHTHVPEDAALVDALSLIASTQTLLDKLLVTNPEGLYGFPPSRE